MSTANQGSTGGSAPAAPTTPIGGAPQPQGFTAEQRQAKSKKVFVAIAAFVVVMILGALASYAVKEWIANFQQQREEKRKEKERLAKTEQKRTFKVFTPSAPASAAPEPVPETAALPANFPPTAASAAQPIPLKESPGRSAPAPAQGQPPRNGGQAAAPPLATMMLGGEPSGKVPGQAGGPAPANPSAGAPRQDVDPRTADYLAKMAALSASAEAAQRGAAAPAASASSGAAAVPIPRGIGRGTVQDFARVNAARQAITNTPQALAAKLGDRTLLLARGAFIPCVLDTQLISNVAGSVKCHTPEAVYSDDGSTVLLDKATTIEGEYGSTLRNGDSRIAVVWSRVKTPDGNVVDVDSPAADGVGTMGVGGHIDNHWVERIGAAFLLSLIDDAVSIEVAKQSEGAVSTRPSATVDTTKSMSQRVLDSTINIPPTISRNRGARIMVMVKRDLWFQDVYAVKAR